MESVPSLAKAIAVCHHSTASFRLLLQHTSCYANGKSVKKRKVKDPSRVLQEKGASKKAKIDKDSNDDCNKHDQFFCADIDDILHFYRENVTERTRDKIVMNILDHQVSELNYVECFKEKGYMNSSIMFLQCALWNEEWKEKAIDKVILSYNAMLHMSGLLSC
ncbi:hypothetical protein ACP4OV_008942 [Aristida adscensionis]